MILGLGIDIVETHRMKKVLKQHGNSFINKVFTEDEISENGSRADKTAFFASRWASKEALSKALGCGIGNKCAWKDIRIQNDRTGKPRIKLGGTALLTARKMSVKKIHLSISHEREYAAAVVVLE